uniref:Uncharacterized protein n=1 Tax=Caenorhabditis japonica TaxID=281687 RepID=A0A8R1DS48_CAEJA
MSIPPDEIAAELQGKMVIDDKTGQKAYYVGELFKLYNSTEGADALQNNLAACGMSLAQLLAEFTDMFSRVGDNSWRAVKTGQFQTILNSQDGGGGARRKTRGGAFGGGGGGGRGYMRGGRGSNIPRAGRPGGAGFKPGVNLLRNRNPSTSSNSTFGSAFHQNPQRAPYVGGRGGFQNTVSNNQRAPDNTWFWNGGNNYNNDNIGRPQRNDNRFFNDGGRRRSPSPSPPPPRQRGYSPSPSPPPTRQSYASYDSHEPDYRHRRFSPSPEPYDSRDNSRPPSRTRTNRTRDDDNYVHRQPNRIPPNEPSRDDLMNMSEFSRFSSDDSFHSMDPDPRNRSNPRNIEDLANRFNAAVVSVPVVTTAPPPGLHLNLNVNASTPTPTPSTSKAPPPPPPPRPAPTDLPALQVNEITYRQAKKCKKAFKRLDEPRVHLTELIAAVETEMKGELPGGNNRGKTEYLERLQKSFPEVLRAIRINKEEGTATKISPPSQPHVEPDDEVTGIIRLYLENKRSTKLIQTKVLSDLEILTEKSVSELVPKLLAVFESEPGKYTWVDEVSSSSAPSAPSATTF